MNIILPNQFINRMREMLGRELELFLEAYEESNYHGLRVNPLKETTDTVEDLKGKFELRQVPWCSDGYYYDENMRPGRHPYHHAGVYYIQEPSAMLVGVLADAKPGMRVLDLCAAPGGKTGHLAGMMQGQGGLVANEIVPQRARILSQNVERMGISNCIVTCENPDRLAVTMPGYFELIVVDTPCSGEGMFRRDEIARTEWSEANVTMCAQRGQDILNAADKMLQYGGKLVYSTCTFAPAEDEQAIATFIASHPEYIIEHVELVRTEGAMNQDGWPSAGREEWCEWPDTDIFSEKKEKQEVNINNTFRLWPHQLHGEGHYAAVLRKGHADKGRVADSGKYAGDKRDKGRKNAGNSKTGNTAAAVRLFEEFAGKFLKFKPEGSYMLFGDNLYLLPVGAPDIASLRIERAGLQLGEIKKDRFEPSHALAMSLNMDNCSKCFNITDENEMLRYLCGESIACDEDISGWCTVCFNGYSAGLGKASGGIIKNHYPKGLRIRI